jgi:hypothetical protein
MASSAISSRSRSYMAQLSLNPHSFHFRASVSFADAVELAL